MISHSLKYSRARYFRHYTLRRAWQIRCSRIREQNRQSLILHSLGIRKALEILYSTNFLGQYLHPHARLRSITGSKVLSSINNVSADYLTSHHTSTSLICPPSYQHLAPWCTSIQMNIGFPDCSVGVLMTQSHYPSSTVDSNDLVTSIN